MDNLQVCQGTCLCAPSPEGYGKGKVLYCYGEVSQNSGNLRDDPFLQVVLQRATFSIIFLIFNNHLISTSSSPGGSTEGKLEGRGGRRGRWWRAGGIQWILFTPFASCSRHWNYFEQFCKIQNISGAHTPPDPAGGSGCPPFPCVSDL